MPRYILDLYVPKPNLDHFETSETDEDYSSTMESVGDLKRVPYQKRELMNTYLNYQKGHKSMIEAGDPIVIKEIAEKEYPWINKGLDELKSMDIQNVSRDHGDDHFKQVLSLKAPNAQRTSDLLEQVVELEADLKGKLKDLSEFKEEIKELGKLLRTTPSRRSTVD
ncbi:uncharacterized protein LOC128991182 [Macrosteles quadrilineatus]|uniref:uncharacterized protein LOC128991182 n=1 Tax=Macrosteles quadrilineatus TaxID=74068 RepID=UPI0023E2EFAF|nr:uncharacterized protein LOC128991182 [Macrosteles quadrilineatus]